MCRGVVRGLQWCRPPTVGHVWRRRHTAGQPHETQPGTVVSAVGLGEPTVIEPNPHLPHTAAHRRHRQQHTVDAPRPRGRLVQHPRIDRGRTRITPVALSNGPRPQRCSRSTRDRPFPRRDHRRHQTHRRTDRRGPGCRFRSKTFGRRVARLGEAELQRFNLVYRRPRRCGRRRWPRRLLLDRRRKRRGSRQDERCHHTRRDRRRQPHPASKPTFSARPHHRIPASIQSGQTSRTTRVDALDRRGRHSRTTGPMHSAPQRSRTHNGLVRTRVRTGPCETNRTDLLDSISRTRAEPGYCARRDEARRQSRARRGGPQWSVGRFPDRYAVMSQRL